jgi:hypothetical protein
MNARAWAVTVAQIVAVGAAVLLIDSIWIVLAAVAGILLWPRTPKEVRTQPTTTREAKNVTDTQRASSQESASKGSGGQNT